MEGKGGNGPRGTIPAPGLQGDRLQARRTHADRSPTGCRPPAPGSSAQTPEGFLQGRGVGTPAWVGQGAQRGLQGGWALDSTLGVPVLCRALCSGDRSAKGRKQGVPGHVHCPHQPPS